MKSIIMTEAGNLLQGPSQHDNLPESGHAQRNPLRLWHERSPSGHMRLCKVWEIMNGHHLVTCGIARYERSWTVTIWSHAALQGMRMRDHERSPFGHMRLCKVWEIVKGHHFVTCGFARYGRSWMVTTWANAALKFMGDNEWSPSDHVRLRMNGHHLISCGFARYERSWTVTILSDAALQGIRVHERSSAALQV